MKIIRMKKRRTKEKTDMFAVMCLVQSVAVIIAVASLWLMSKTDPAAFFAAENFISGIFETDIDFGGFFTTDGTKPAQPLPGGMAYISGNQKEENALSDGSYTQTDKTEEKETTKNIAEVFGTVGINAVLPVTGVITSPYGVREHPIYSGESFHSGEDIAAAEGTPVYCVLDGTVTETGTAEMAGNYVKIEHENGMQTLYCHCSEIYVTENAVVRSGEKIAAVGQTGLATGPHLHFELRINGESTDPEILLSEAVSVS